MPRFRFSARFWPSRHRGAANEQSNSSVSTSEASSDVPALSDDFGAGDDDPDNSLPTEDIISPINTEDIVQEIEANNSPLSSGRETPLIRYSMATEALPQQPDSARSRGGDSSGPQTVTVLLRESDHQSRLLGRASRHVIRRYHFIWSSDGTDSRLWSNPIRLRSYLSQFCSGLSRRVIPRGASIEVVLYPHLIDGTPNGFNPISITRIYCMIHPIHPPANWSNQFPMDFDGTSWSNYISDIGMNALAGTLLDTPIPPSLPNTLMQITPTQLHAVERPSSTVTDVTSLAPNISEDPPSPPLESIQSNESVISSNVTHQSEDDITTNDDSNSISVSNQSSSSSSSSANQPNVTSQEDVAHPSTPFIFPDLPNKGIHEYNLFVPPSYVLGPIIGEGEFAKVRMACNLVTNGAVAIKAYRRRRGGLSSSIDEQMLREVNILKGLRCRNIVKVFETLVHGDRVFMIMEIMTKGDMRKYINKVGALKETNARKMFADVLNGIAYLHQNNIVHLDLKLENLLLNQDMVVKITDFGCARFQIGRKCFDNPCGSYAYGAPEVISGQSYDGKKADVWSLGIILYCMVSARLPYADDGKLADLMWERRRSPDIPSWVTLECCKLIRLSLRYRAERRVEILEMMTHPWMWADTRKLPWYKPTTAKMMEQFYEHF